MKLTNTAILMWSFLMAYLEISKLSRSGLVQQYAIRKAMLIELYRLRKTQPTQPLFLLSIVRKKSRLLEPFDLYLKSFPKTQQYHDSYY